MSHSVLFYQEIIEPIEDRMIRSIWRVTRNAADAEDAMQDALVAIWRRRNRIAGHSSPQALILRICVDTAYDVARRRARHRRRLAPPDSADEVIGDDRPPWEGMVQRELSDDILTAINGLSRRQAAAITLRIFEDLPYEQIAAAMHCSVATARKHVERARRHLRRVLSEHETDPLARSRP